MTRIDAHGMISRKRFLDTGGWGFAQFNYDAASDTFTPDGSDANCGYACHTIVAAKDYIFTAQTGTMSAFWHGSEAAGATHQRSAVGRQHRTRRRQC
jgi:Cytochrome P460